MCRNNENVTQCKHKLHQGILFTSELLPKSEWSFNFLRQLNRLLSNKSIVAEQLSLSTWWAIFQIYNQIVFLKNVAFTTEFAILYQIRYFINKKFF